MAEFKGRESDESSLNRTNEIEEREGKETHGPSNPLLSAWHLPRLWAPAEKGSKRGRGQKGLNGDEKRRVDDVVRR